MMATLEETKNCNQRCNYVSSQAVSESWKLLVEKDTIDEALHNLSTQIIKEYAPNEVILVGVLTGAAYFTIDLSRRLSFNHQVNLLRVSSYHNSQTSSDKVEITGLSHKELNNLSNKHILVLDELYDSGRTLHEVVSYLKCFNPMSIKTCVMFRKAKKLDDDADKDKFDLPDYCGIDNLPDVWYVGYGLDDCGTKRQLTNLYAVPKLSGIPLTPDDSLFNDEEVYLQAIKQAQIIPAANSD